MRSTSSLVVTSAACSTAWTRRPPGRHDGGARCMVGASVSHLAQRGGVWPDGSRHGAVRAGLAGAGPPRGLQPPRPAPQEPPDSAKVPACGLRAALAQSGADHLLVELLHRDALVWAGYSAGRCVLASSLRGLELMVDPGAVQACYGPEPIWEGLGLLAYAIVPHYRSQHPQSEAAERLVARYRAERVARQALRDGQAIVIDAGPSALDVDYMLSRAGTRPACRRFAL